MPNDPKLSDCGGWRAGCMVGGKAAAEAASVTAGAVRCSEWLDAVRYGPRKVIMACVDLAARRVFQIGGAKLSTDCLKVCLQSSSKCRNDVKQPTSKLGMKKKSFGDGVVILRDRLTGRGMRRSWSKKDDMTALDAAVA